MMVFTKISSPHFDLLHDIFSNLGTAFSTSFGDTISVFGQEFPDHVHLVLAWPGTHGNSATIAVTAEMLGVITNSKPLLEKLVASLVNPKTTALTKYMECLLYKEKLKTLVTSMQLFW